MKKLLVTTVAFAMLFTVPSQATETLTIEQRIELIQNEVRETLKDPDSAKFGKVGYRFIKKGEPLYFYPNTLQVCGMVNAKNSFGAYTGGKVYTGSHFEKLSTGSGWLIPSDPEFDYIMNPNETHFESLFKQSCTGIDMK